jgi:putative nucleotidyltransferase with HDIG domain
LIATVCLRPLRITEKEKELNSAINLNELIARAHELKPLPGSTVRLSDLMSSPTAAVGDFAEVIAFDPALTLKILKAANSVSKGGWTRIATVHDAVLRLGTAQVLALAFATSVGPALRKGVPAYGLEAGQLWRHSVAAAVIAEALPRYCGARVPPGFVAAALLHDLGKPVIGRFLKPRVCSLMRRAQSEGGRSPVEAEMEILAVHHGELGGIIARHWKLPETIVNGIVHHHTPEKCPEPICDLVYLANIGAKKIEAGLAGKRYEVLLNPGSLERLEITSDSFASLCAERISRFQEISLRYNAV